MSPEHCFNDKSEILLHPGNKNFASQRQNYAQKMQDAQVTKSLKNHDYRRQSSDSLQLRPFSLMELLLRKELAPLWELILSFKSSSLWHGKSLLPH